jgi:hypothetical protein
MDQKEYLYSGLPSCAMLSAVVSEEYVASVFRVEVGGLGNYSLYRVSGVSGQEEWSHRAMGGGR